MGDALVSELLIALFAGLVGIVTFRRNTPRPVEIAVWAGLVWVCILAFTNTHSQQARELTAAALWGASQMVGTVVGVIGQGFLQWISANRFVIADWVVLLAGVDLIALALISTRRQAQGWQPRVRLGDWMELPRPGKALPAAVRADGVEEINRRFNLWAPVAAAAAATWFTLLLIWTGEVAMPTTARKLKRAAQTADGARRRVAAADWQGLIEKAGTEPRRLTEQVVDIDVLARRAAAMKVKASGWLTEVGTAPQVDWFGGFGALPPHMDGGIDVDGAERDRRDRLAS